MNANGQMEGKMTDREEDETETVAVAPWWPDIVAGGIAILTLGRSRHQALELWSSHIAS